MFDKSMKKRLEFMKIYELDDNKLKFRHVKKKIKYDISSEGEKYSISVYDFFIKVDLNYDTYQSILEELIQKYTIHHVKDRFEKKETHEYFKKILYTLSIYNFQYKTQIKSLFLYLISDKTIANSIKKYKPTKIKNDECLNTYNYSQHFESNPKDFTKMIEIVFEDDNLDEKIQKAYDSYKKDKNIDKNYREIFNAIQDRKFQIYQILNINVTKIIRLSEAKKLDLIYKKYLSLQKRLDIVDSIEECRKEKKPVKPVE